jgi:hypothetical protein
MKDRISLFITATLMISALAVLVSCSVTIESGEVQAFHHRPATATDTPAPWPTPTPTPT